MVDKHEWLYDDVQGSDDWREQDECQRCGDGGDEVDLRGIKMRDGGRAMLCQDCFEVELDRGNVRPDDERLS